MTEVEADRIRDDGIGATSGNAAPIWIAFGMALLALAGIGTVSYRSIQLFASSVGWVADTYIEIEQLKTVLETSDAAVSAERLYVLTGDPSRLQPVTIGHSFGAGQMRQMAVLTADNPEQQRRLVELRPLLDEQVSLLDQVVAIRAQRGRDAALSFLLDHKMPELLARIHTLVKTMIAVENRRLDRRADTVLADARFALRLLMTDTIGAFCIVLFAALYIWRIVARLHRMSQIALQRSRERTSSETALRAQSTLLQSVFDAMIEGVIVTHGAASAPTLNPAARQILAIDESMTWGDWLRSASVWQDGKSEPLTPDAIARLATDPRSGEIEMLLRQPADGAPRNLSALPIKFSVRPWSR